MLGHVMLAGRCGLWVTAVHNLYIAADAAWSADCDRDGYAGHTTVHVTGTGAGETLRPHRRPLVS